MDLRLAGHVFAFTELAFAITKADLLSKLEKS